jgi:predicted PurR-regulated permease PerM
VNGTAVTAVWKSVFVGIAYFICGVPHPAALGLTIASAFVPWIVLIVATLTMPVHSESWLARIVFFAIGAAVLTISDKPSCRRSFAKPRSYHCCWF